MSSISYDQRKLFSTAEVDAEMAELGLPTGYPDRDSFTEEEIAEAVAKLSDSSLYSDVATLADGNYPPAVLTAFAKLAEVLHSEVHTAGYGGLKIRRPTSDSERRSSALSALASKVYDANRDKAYTSLLAKMDATDPTRV